MRHSVGCEQRLASMPVVTRDAGVETRGLVSLESGKGEVEHAEDGQPPAEGGEGEALVIHFEGQMKAAATTM